MISHVRGWIAGFAALAFVAGLLLSSSQAADDKALTEGVQKNSAAFEKKDSAGAKKIADELGKKVALDDLMHLFTLRTKKGLGVGSKPGAVSPDGIERKLTDLAKKPLADKALADESAALAQMGYDMAAIAAVA